MLAKSLLIPALASLACAESTVTSMLIYFADNQPLAASIVGNDATATTYSINCRSGTPGDECGMGPGLYLTAAGDTTTYAMDEDEFFHFTIQCTNTGSSAICTESAGGPEANFPGKSTSTVPLSERIPVTVTAGSVTRADASATSTSSESGSGSESASTGSASETSASASKTAGASQTADDETADPTETGAAVRITGLTGMAVGGVAVVIMGAVL